MNLKFIKMICIKAKLLIKANKKLPRVKDQYTITELFPSKDIMENALKNAL